MDDFPLEHTELNGALISMEFGPGGRIQQLWAADPNLPDAREEFQFVLPPIHFGEEFSEDYNPGTILIGARTSPDDPWILSRNAEAQPIETDQFNSARAAFEYEFSLLPEIQATGVFREVSSPLPLIVWDLEIVNRGRQSLEIGELAFPFAFNNLLEGYPRTDEGIKNMLMDRVTLHQHIGGSASYIYAQRLIGEPPGLLVFPGEDTMWQFYCHVPASINTAFRWQGIPVAYLYSQAAIEREGWPEWYNEHTSTIMEPGESRKFQTCFASVVREGQEGVLQTLSSCGRPAVRILPSAVAPTDVGIALEIEGSTPARFYSTPGMELETDSDEEGGFCFVKPDEPGVVRVSFDDTRERTSHTYLLFIKPIAELIQKRASWIVEHQIVDLAKSSLDGAIVCVDIEDGKQAVEAEDYASPVMIECSLGDALFLAEKNTSYPVEREIEVLDDYLDRFLQDDLQNPLDGAVGSTFPSEGSVANGYGRAQVYPLVINLFGSMVRVAETYGARRSPTEYLECAIRTAEALFRHASGPDWRKGGLLGMAELGPILERAKRAGIAVDDLEQAWIQRRTTLGKLENPFAGDAMWTTTGFDEVHAIAAAEADEERQDRIRRIAYVARSLSPSWWWYGNDQRWLEDLWLQHPAMLDKGELCLGPTTSANASLLLRSLDRDYGNLPDTVVRQAFGGLFGVWALVRDDGAGASGYCPDAASRQFGMSQVTGDVGLTLYHYLRLAASYVLPTADSYRAFGCTFDTDKSLFGEDYVVRPWDGLGRRVVVRQIGLDVEASFGRIETLRFDVRKRWMQVTLHNPADRPIVAVLTTRGLWGRDFVSADAELRVEGVTVVASIELAPGAEKTFEIRVKE